jgi:hypothetical protein
MARTLLLSSVIMTKRISWHRLAIAALVGCAATTSYMYSPQDASYWADGYPATATAVPPESPQGKVEVTSFGVVEITPDGFGPIAALHVRLAVINEGDTTAWTVTTTEQLVEIPGEGRSRPMYVNTNLASLPAAAVAQRERRVFDLYYPLPAGIVDDDDLPVFDFLWQVTTSARTFASRTRFSRFEQESPSSYTRVTLYTGWGPYWWYDPFYPRLVFIRHRPIVIHRPGRVIITRPPTWHYRALHDHRR